ncbi:MAG: hypothetical protein U0946_04025 [Patescibacteria group bacterium]|nr:hypothetical protein [Patescibacteria group bacterium]
MSENLLTSHAEIGMKEIGVNEEKLISLSNALERFCKGGQVDADLYLKTPDFDPLKLAINPLGEATKWIGDPDRYFGGIIKIGETSIDYDIPLINNTFLEPFVTFAAINYVYNLNGEIYLPSVVGRRLMRLGLFLPELTVDLNSSSWFAAVALGKFASLEENLNTLSWLAKSHHPKQPFALLYRLNLALADSPRNGNMVKSTGLEFLSQNPIVINPDLPPKTEKILSEGYVNIQLASDDPHALLLESQILNMMHPPEAAERIMLETKQQTRPKIIGMRVPSESEGDLQQYMLHLPTDDSLISLIMGHSQFQEKIYRSLLAVQCIPLGK